MDVSKFITPGTNIISHSNYNSLKAEAQRLIKEKYIVIFTNTPFRKPEEMQYYTDLVTENQFKY